MNKHNQFAVEVFPGGNKQLVICLNKKRKKEIRTLQYCSESREYGRQGHKSRSTPAASCVLALPWVLRVSLLLLSSRLDRHLCIKCGLKNTVNYQGLRLFRGSALKLKKPHFSGA